MIVIKVIKLDRCYLNIKKSVESVNNAHKL